VERITHKDSASYIRQGDSAALPFGDGEVNAVLTSPPYCTRIDYATTTRLELAVMHGLIQSCHVDLGRKMLGSVRVPQRDIKIKDSWGPTCGNFLSRVAEHTSKASASYYLKTHLDYYDKLDRSLNEISRVLAPGSVAVIVVQDSYYKEIHNDLPRVTSEMCAQKGLILNGRGDFAAKKTMASINRRSKPYRDSARALESVLSFVRSKD
jgi:tRNA G10  N-methylase Trm11